MVPVAAHDSAPTWAILERRAHDTPIVSVRTSPCPAKARQDATDAIPGWLNAAVRPGSFGERRGGGRHGAFAKRKSLTSLRCSLASDNGSGGGRCGE